MPRTSQPRQPHLTRAGILLLCLLPGLARADEKPRAKASDRQAQAELRHYLPVLLQKALLDNDREQVGQMEKLLEVYEVFLERGILSQDKLWEARKLLLEDRVRLLRRQAAYGDALDGYRSRFEVPAERLQRWEDSALRPLLRHLQAFEALYADVESAREPVEQARKQPSKMRSLIEKATTSSKLVAGTRFRQPFAKTWKTWKETKDVEAARKKALEEREKIREQQRRNFQAGNKDEEKLIRRFQEILFEIDVGELERALRNYEQEPWKEAKDVRQRLGIEITTFHPVWRTLSGVLDYAFGERLGRLEKSWPALPAIQVEKVDLLTCKPEQAEEIVAGRIKDKPAALSCKSKVRKLRAAEEIYHLQQRAVSLVFLQRANRREYLFHPPNVYEGGDEGLTGPVFPRPRQPSEEAPLRLLDAQQALGRARADLLRTWLDYQQLRLELYADLGLTPP